MTLRELFENRSGRIRCLYKGHTVRTLVFQGDLVDIDTSIRAEDGTLLDQGPTVGVSADTVLTFEPWTMDRGSVLFMYGKLEAKLCTEGDYIDFDDGSRKGVPGQAAFQ